MKRWSDWEIIHRKVSIAGCIVDQQNNPVCGARITIAAKAGKVEAKVENASLSAGDDREIFNKWLDQTFSRSDGIYFFLDIPDGQYTVSVIEPRSGKSIQSHVTVSMDKEKKESGRIAQTDFTLPA